MERSRTTMGITIIAAVPIPKRVEKAQAQRNLSDLRDPLVLFHV